MKKLIILLVLLASIASAQETVVGVVKWRVAANTNNFWYVAAFTTEQLNSEAAITNRMLVVAMTDNRWDNTNTQAKAKIFFRRFVNRTEPLTAAKITTFTNTLPSGIRVAFADDASQALKDSGLEPIPTE